MVDQSSGSPAPAHSGPLFQILKEVFEKAREDRSGDVATYIPELARVAPDGFGMCIATVDGTVYEFGDSTTEFTIQSISKPFVYGLALELKGPKPVHAKVGVEPSGDAFNSISLEKATGRPLNPMINAGAIAMSSFLRSTLGDKALDRTLEWFSMLAGRTLKIDDRVFESESSTGHRNRAIAHLLRNFNIVADPVEEGLSLYFKQCSILVHCRDLALFGAALANRGMHPITQKRTLSADHLDKVMSVMTTCGMYNYAGQWLYEVGLPAKSGVAGGIVAVLPGRMGIGLFSPRLDAQGNSVRGIRVCTELSRRFRLHLFDVPRTSKSAIRSETNLAQRPSTRVRPGREMSYLRRSAKSVPFFELQGDLDFAAMEVVQRRVWERTPTAPMVFFDLSRVYRADEAAGELFGRMADHILERRLPLYIAGIKPRASLGLLLLGNRAGIRTFPSVDAAAEAAEEFLLESAHPSPSPTSSTPLTLDELEVGEQLSADNRRILAAYLAEKSHPAGATFVKKGDRADEIFFLTSGIVSVRIPLDNGAVQRLATLTPGTVFGEMSVIDRGLRSTDLCAESDMTCLTLSLEHYDRLGQEAPEVKFHLLEYLIRVLSTRLRKANDQIAALAVSP